MIFVGEGVSLLLVEQLFMMLDWTVLLPLLPKADGSSNEAGFHRNRHPHQHKLSLRQQVFPHGHLQYPGPTAHLSPQFPLQSASQEDTAKITPLLCCTHTHTVCVSVRGAAGLLLAWTVDDLTALRRVMWRSSWNLMTQTLIRGGLAHVDMLRPPEEDHVRCWRPAPAVTKAAIISYQT